MTFANDAVAHTAMQGLVSAPRYCEGTAMSVTAPVAAIRARPCDAGLDRQILFGHAVTVLDIQDGMAFARDDTSGFVGYIDARDLGPAAKATHRVDVRASFAFATASFKAPDPVPLSLGSLVCVTEVQGKYARLSNGRYAIAAHLTPVGTAAPDPVTEAEKLLGTAYLWGGNSAFGIDCSGLVQMGLQACKIACPGDSDLQETALGIAVPPDSTPQRGDLMFWKGHVAWVCDPQTLLHANAHHMAVAYEPIKEALQRIAAQGDGPRTRHSRLTR